MRGPPDPDEINEESEPIPLTGSEQVARVLMVSAPFVLAALIWLVFRVVSS